MSGPLEHNSLSSSVSKNANDGAVIYSILAIDLYLYLYSILLINIFCPVREATATRRDGGWSGAQPSVPQPSVDSKRTRSRRLWSRASVGRDSGLGDEEGEGSWKPPAGAAPSTHGLRP